MVCLTYCIACRYGQHDGHIKDFAPAPEGVMGGAQCPCDGECVAAYKPPPPIVDALCEALDTRGLELLREVEEGTER